MNHSSCASMDMCEFLLQDDDIIQCQKICRSNDTNDMSKYLMHMYNFYHRHWNNIRKILHGLNLRTYLHFISCRCTYLDSTTYKAGKFVHSLPILKHIETIVLYDNIFFSDDHWNMVVLSIKDWLAKLLLTSKKYAPTIIKWYFKQIVPFFKSDWRTYNCDNQYQMSFQDRIRLFFNEHIFKYADRNLLTSILKTNHNFSTYGEKMLKIAIMVGDINAVHLLIDTYGVLFRDYNRTLYEMLREEISTPIFIKIIVSHRHIIETRDYDVDFDSDYQRFINDVTSNLICGGANVLSTPTASSDHIKELICISMFFGGVHREVQNTTIKMNKDLKRVHKSLLPQNISLWILLHREMVFQEMGTILYKNGYFCYESY